MSGWTCPKCRGLFRRAGQSHGRYRHVANVRTVEDFDGGLRALLTEAYVNAPA